LRIARSARPSLDKRIGRSYAAKRFRQLRESPSSSLGGGRDADSESRWLSRPAARCHSAPPQGHGFSGFQICWRHLLPNLAPLIIAQATVSFGYVMVDLAAISFLGLGVQPPSPTATVPPAAD
jgi:hypothetical protein